MGSLEAGKHADLVIWSGNPLSILSRCEQTWIDGRRYFDVERDRLAREEAKQQRASLIQEILASGDEMASEEEEKNDDELRPGFRRADAGSVPDRRG